MLTGLFIKNFAIIKTLDVSLESGMTVLTGETGAGKSILLDAIGLVLGDKADTKAIRHGNDSAEISLSIDIEHTPEAAQWLLDHDLTTEDGDCVLRRVITKQGKSRAWINGRPANLNQMRELGEQMVNIHGQHEHQSLMKNSHQQDLLDGFAGLEPDLIQLGQHWDKWQTLRERISSLQESESQLSERQALLRFQLEEFDSLAISEDEWRNLERDHAHLANASYLQNTSSQAHHTLYEADNSIMQQLQRMEGQLREAAEIDAELLESAEAIQTAYLHLEVAVTSLKQRIATFQEDPEALSNIEARLSQLKEVSRKYRVMPELLYEHQQKLTADYSALISDHNDLSALEEECDLLEKEFREKASSLSSKRQKAARKFSQEITIAMQTLGMEGGRFDVVCQVDTAQHNRKGIDTIRFEVTANPGQPLQDLKKVASGGELSRISLAIQMIAAQKLRLPALIFDEVDAGIGGAVADIVARQLRNLSVNRQVLCVTHLPQVAAKSHQHILIKKTKEQNGTTTGLIELTPAERIEEIARMLGGKTITKATLDLAAEMISTP